MELLVDKFEYVIIQFDDNKALNRVIRQTDKKYEIIDAEKHILKIYTKTGRTHMQKELGYLLNELANLNYDQGRFSGKWSVCQDKEELSEQYLEKMQNYADAFEIPYNKKLKNNFPHDEWEEYQDYGIEYAREELAHNLKCKVQNQILSNILETIK